MAELTISEQLRELLAEATPGDWQTNGSHVYGPDPDRELVCQFVNWPNEDRELIVFLRNNAPHFATLEDENVRLREAGKRLLSWWPENSGNSPQGKAKGDGYADDLEAFRAALQEQPK